MKVVKCQNEHFFDYDKYVLCPHCGAEVANAANGNGDKKAPQKKGLFSKKEKAKDLPSSTPRSFEPQPHTEYQKTPSVPTTMTDPMPVPVSVTGKTEPMPISTDPVPMQLDTVPDEVPVGNKTYDIWRGTPAKETAQEKTPDEKLAEVMAPVKPVVVEESREDEEPAKPADTFMKAPEPADSLEKAIKKVSSNEEGRTIGFFSQVAHTPSAVPDATAAAQSEGPVEPVVGWLVCCGGALLGRAYNIVAGRNSIGRLESNKIVIKDNQVSREKHAWISYEPKKREFYIQPGESSGLTYLNGDNIMIPQKLNHHDMIEIGGSKFIFVPLCDEVFSWEEYIK